jgi:hypothetical protein
MILGDPAAASAAQQGQCGITIDEVFRRVALKHPDQPALIDAPNRAAFTGGEPRQLIYAQADRMVSAIAGRLRRMGIPTDAVVGIQLPNIAENIVAILGVLRAGMIAAPMPLLWRRADAAAAQARVGAKALITCGRVGKFDHAHLAMRIAADVFSIRYVCGFGENLPDGVVPFDDLFCADRLDPNPPLEGERLTNASAHVALITFDTGDTGIVPVARNHRELLAGGFSVTLESRLAQQAHILSTIAPSSFAGVSLTLMPWLLSAGTLSLHHPFDAEVLVEQQRDDNCRTLILPGPIALLLSESGAFARAGIRTVIGAWRSPERLSTSSTWREPEAAFIDVPIFGETGFVASRRTPEGRAAPLPLGPIATPQGGTAGPNVVEVVRTAASTVALRGPMVPRHAFPPGIERSGLPHFRVDSTGLVDTRYACRIDSVSKALVVTGAPSGIVSVGGYRFSQRELQEAVEGIDGGATLAALPAPLIGQRLIGNAEKRDAVRAALSAAGANPIVADAFRDRTERADPARA